MLRCPSVLLAEIYLWMMITAQAFWQNLSPCVDNVLSVLCQNIIHMMEILQLLLVITQEWLGKKKAGKKKKNGGFTAGLIV